MYVPGVAEGVRHSDLPKTAHGVKRLRALTDSSEAY